MTNSGHHTNDNDNYCELDLASWEEEALEAMWKERDKKAEEAYSDTEPTENAKEGAKLYLLHFHGGAVAGHAGHYLGYSNNVDRRLEEHKAGTGSPLVAAAYANGLTPEVVRVWDPGTRGYERALKNQKNLPRLCPVCREKALAKHAERMRASRLRKKQQQESPTTNELSDEARQAITEAREASTAAKKSTAWFPGRGESTIEHDEEILSPRAKAHHYAGIAYQRNRIRAFDLAARNHTLAAKAHRLAAKDSLEVALRSAHRKAALAHYQAVRANKRASRLIERVNVENTEVVANILYRDIHHEGEFYPVYKNPSTYQLEHILRSDPDKEVRGLIHPESGDVYVWGAAGGGLLHKHMMNHYLEGELPYNSHRIFLQKLVHGEDPNETHMSVRGGVGKHVKDFAAKHGIRLNETFAENAGE